MIIAPFKVVLDANVLYPFSLRDTLLRAASAALFQIYWSEEILEETRRNLLRSARLTEEQANRLIFVRPRQLRDDSLKRAATSVKTAGSAEQQRLRSGVQRVEHGNLVAKQRILLELGESETERTEGGAFVRVDAG